MVCAVNKIDSNVSGLRFAEEDCPKQLGPTPTWYPAEPNSYPDFGAQYTLLARDPISAERQRLKGAVTDMDSTGGWNTDVTATNLRRLMQGFCFADERTATASGPVVLTGATTTVAPNGLVTLKSTTITANYFLPGEWLYVGSDTKKLGNTYGFARVASVAAGSAVLDKVQWSTLTPEATATDIEIFRASIIRNEFDPNLIKRRTYQLERTLGNDANGQQAEYVVGACPNQLTIQMQQANKVTADLAFVAMDADTRTGAQGIKSKDAGAIAPALVSEDMFNTSSDVTRINLAVVDKTNSKPKPLFAFATDLSIVINNNISPNKAIGVLGAMDTTAGNFEVGGSVTAYFADVASVAAVRNNADVTLDVCVVKKGKGIVFDIPLLTLGNGRLQVVQNQAITIPLDTTAAKGQFGYTLGTFWFDKLPAIANKPAP